MLPDIEANTKPVAARVPKMMIALIVSLFIVILLKLFFKNS
jgi:hypothetical protein